MNVKDKSMQKLVDILFARISECEENSAISIKDYVEAREVYLEISNRLTAINELLKDGLNK